MPEEKKGIEVPYEIISEEDYVEVTSEGRMIPGKRIAFTTADIPYERFFIPKEEYSVERVQEEIKKRIVAFKKPERKVGKVII